MSLQEETPEQHRSRRGMQLASRFSFHGAVNKLYELLLVFSNMLISWNILQFVIDSHIFQAPGDEPRSAMATNGEVMPRDPDPASS